MTSLVKLEAKSTDSQEYTTYVFYVLDDKTKRQTDYIMCTRFPKWDARSIDIGEVGFLEFVEIRAGIDKWFNGVDFIPYNYNMIQFIKFVERKEKPKHKFTM